MPTPSWPEAPPGAKMPSRLSGCYARRIRGALACLLTMSVSRLGRVDESPGADFGIPGHFDRDQIRPAMGERLLQRSLEVIRRAHARGGHAEGLGEFHEIRIDEIGRHDAAVKALALVASDVAIGV